MKKKLIFLAGIPLVAILLLVLILPALLRSEQIQSRIMQQVKHHLPPGVELGTIELSYFPLPHIRTGHVRVEHPLSDGQNVSVAAGSLEIFPSLLKLLFGKVELWRLAVRRADITIKFRSPGMSHLSEIKLNDIHLEARHVGRPRYVSGSFHGTVFSGQPNTDFSLTYEGSSEGPWWQGAVFESKGSFEQIVLSEMGTALLPSRQGYLKKGIAAGNWRVRKERNAEHAEAELELHLKGVDYQQYGSNAYVKLDTAALACELSLDLKTSALEFKSFSLDSNVADLVGRGKIYSGEPRQGGQSVDLELTVMQLRLDALQQALPAPWLSDYRLDGNGRINLLLRGDLDHLQTKLETNFTEAKIERPDIFQKKRGVLLELGGNFLLENQDRVSGDFELRLHDAVAKGTIVEYVRSTTDYNVTFLTNSFNLAHLSELLYALRNSTLSGQLKWLLSCKGRLTSEAFPQVVTHLTPLQVSWSQGDRVWLKDLSGALDWENETLAIKDLRFSAGTLPVEIALQGYGPLPADFTYSVKVAGGVVDGKGVLDKMGQHYVSSLNTRAADLDVNALVAAFSPGPSPLEGRAHLTGVGKTEMHLDGSPSVVESQGTFRLLNGKLNSVDIMSSLGGIPKLIMFAAESRGFTAFDVMESEYFFDTTGLHLSNGRLQSNEFDMEFQGKITPDERLDITLGILLSHSLSKRVISGIAEGQALRLPGRISGTVAAPKVSIDPAIVGSIIQSLIFEGGKDVFTRVFTGARPDASSQTPSSGSSGGRSLPIGSRPGGTDQIGGEQTGSQASLEDELIRTGVSLISNILGGGRQSNDDNSSN